MKKELMKKVINLINFSVKVDANSTSTFLSFQPKLPKKYNEYKIKK